MAAESDVGATVSENQQPQQKIQLYPTSTGEISSFWREKYERDANKYWDIFYKRHQDKFFKDRHYLDKEWGNYFSGAGRKVILEVGCGAGNTIFPLLAAYSDIFIHACDFSPRAVNLVKMHKDFKEDRISAFICDLTVDDLSQQISPSSVDIVTMVFVLSAVSPEKMPLVIQNIRKIMKPDGYVLFRDYATGDLAQERFSGKEQKICENFYVRDEFLRNLFKENGFSMEEHVLCCKQVENRSREIVMNRRWVQAVFKAAHGNCMSGERTGKQVNHMEEDCYKPKVKDITWKDATNRSEIDLSEGMGVDMFGISSSSEEIVDIIIRDDKFKIKVLSKEYQHTCKSTGLILWESARLMASILASNPAIVSGRRVLEIGCGCGGICSMVAARSADLVVATDGDTKVLDLLTENIALNLKSPSLERLITKKLEWGNKNDIDYVKQLSEKGFEVILGTDVTYVAEAIIPLFATARELISSSRVVKDREPALILCHVFRRVDEPSILSAASQFGFRLVDRWPEQTPTGPYQGTIKSWFSEGDLEVPTAALNIMYFQSSTSD
ncbi:uncharacterized protein LOC111407483 isoform X3 [Olea europaea var. sylvestris]|uniref:uncharacterized protein LOC111407483 isoform X3 n=1 Tax=Olea europaea var. sylvestris TaxID=158386 RepID=UPI000C1D490D|nr:uncharacterized protein LOC111407483 isoform X3 [Olea europaea var. sylvestris]